MVRCVPWKSGCGSRKPKPPSRWSKEAEASFEVVEALRDDVRQLRVERDRAIRDLELARLGIQ